MKKTFLCLSIIFIMIFCTFCAGCIDNGTVNTENINPQGLQTSNNAQDVLDNYLSIIANPTDDYVITKATANAPQFVGAKYISVGVKTDTTSSGWYGVGDDIVKENFKHVNDGVAINLAFFILKDPSITQNYSVKISRIKKESNSTTKLCHIFFITPKDYDVMMEKINSIL